jgi:predicted ATP-grasp superfamily ATP-dependent carboligase
MTAEEKAKELVDKYRNSIMSFLNDRMKDMNAKQCALIAVGEIKEQLTSNLDNEVSAMHAIYWEKVKQEIEKL